VTEGNSGPSRQHSPLAFQHRRKGVDVSFDVATTDGTAATANSDYVAKS
jgi:hypothetical protein